MKPYSSETMIAFLESLTEEQRDFFLENFCSILGAWFMGELTGKAKSKWPDLVVGSKYTQLDALSIMLLHLRPYFPPLIKDVPVYRITHVKTLPEKKVVRFDATKQFKPLTSWTTSRTPYVSDREESKMRSIILEHDLSGSKGVLTDYKALDILTKCLGSHAFTYYLKRKGLQVYGLNLLKQDLARFSKEREVFMYSGNTPMKCTWRLAAEEANMKTQVAASNAKVEVEAKVVGSTFYFGVKWDKYTPQVEAQLTKDLIAMVDQAQTLKLNLVAVCESSEADRVFLSMNVRRLPLSTFATMWLLYKTHRDSDVEMPEHAKRVLIREMFTTVAPPTIDTGRHSGYSLAPQGRVAPPRIGVNRPAPNSTAKPDYALILLWC